MFLTVWRAENRGKSEEIEEARAPTRSPQGTERGRTPRRTPPIFTRAALPAGHRPAWPPRGPRRRRASPAAAGRASSTRSPAVDAAGVTAGRGMASPRRRPRPAASAAGPWPKRGRLSPSDAKRSEGQRSGAAAPRVRGEAAHGGKTAAAWGKARPMGAACNGGKDYGLLLLRTAGIVGVKDSSKRDT